MGSVRVCEMRERRTESERARQTEIDSERYGFLDSEKQLSLQREMLSENTVAQNHSAFHVFTYFSFRHSTTFSR